MLRRAARGKFTAIISLDGLIEAASCPHCLLPACKELCVPTMQKYAPNAQIYRYYPDNYGILKRLLYFCNST